MMSDLTDLQQRVANLEAQLAAITTPSHANVVNQMASLLTAWQGREDEFRAWMSGAAGGGPNADGRYPLTDTSGYTTLMPSPAQIAQDANKLVMVELTGANAFTLTANDGGRAYKVFNSTNPITINLPNGVAPGWNALFFQFSTGRLTFAVPQGATLVHDQGMNRSRGQYSAIAATCIHRNSGGGSTIALTGSLAI